MANPSQWPAIIGTLGGALVGGGFVWLTDVGRWRRQQRVRWDERRVALYAQLLGLTHDAVTYASNVAGPSGRAPDDARALMEDARERMKEIKGRIASGQASAADSAGLISAEQSITEAERRINDSRRLVKDSEGLIKKIEEANALHGEFFLFSKNPVTKRYNACIATFPPLLRLARDDAATSADWDAAIHECESARGAFVFAARKELDILH